MNIHNRTNLHAWKQTESTTETIFTGLLFVASLITLIFLTSCH